MGKARKKSHTRRKKGQDGRPVTLLDMPDVVLVEVLRCLPIPSRFHVSCTCKRLQTLFHHPQVWRHVSIEIVGYVLEQTYFSGKSAMPMMSSGVFELYLNLFQRFGHYVQSLSLTLHTGCDRLAPFWGQLIELVTKKCGPVLRNLVLRPLVLVSEQENAKVQAKRFLVQRKYLKSFIELIQASSHLRSLSVCCWPRPDPRQPLHDGTSRTDGLCVFEATLKSDLNLTRLEVYNQKDGPRSYYLCQHVETGMILQLLRKFQNLQALSLRHDLMDEAVLQELSSSDRTNSLRQLHVDYFRTSSCRQEELDLWKVNDDTWRTIKVNNPQLRIGFHFCYLFSVSDVMKCLAPSIPLVDIKFFTWNFSPDEESVGLLARLADTYFDTLEKLTLSGLSGSSVPWLVATAKSCQRLTTLHVVSTVRIHYSVLLEIAEIRGPSWRCLKFPRYAICCEHHPEGVGPCKDARCPSLYPESVGAAAPVPAGRARPAEARKVSTVEELESAVSDILGYSWTLEH